MTPSIAENLQAVRQRVAEAARRSGRAPGTVALLAVSKKQPAAAVREAFAAGQRLFGENYVQEALEKMEQVGPGPVWHLIGHLQSNKARLVPGRFQVVQTVDSERLAHALDRHAGLAGGRLEVLLQVNWSREASKAGIQDREGLRRLVEALRGCPNLTLRGLMTIPDPDYSEAETRALYAEVRGLHASLKAGFGLGAPFNELSMGMSHDFEWAIEEGATLVRVGTAIFGARA